jgi:glycosyltransferase involved in cell wall biosynthesis
MRVGYDAQAFLSPRDANGKRAQLRTLLGPYIDRFVGFASTDPNLSGMPLVREGASGYNLWQQFSLPSSLRRHEIDLFLASSNTAPLFLPKKIDLVLALHDTILMKGFRSSSLHGQVLNTYRRWQIPQSVARARIVLTVSEHARCDILHAFPHANVRIIPCTLPPPWFEPVPLLGRDGYILMVTSPAPHKNADGAIEAYSQYARQVGRQARPLKIVGLCNFASLYQKRLEPLGIAPLVTFLPFVSEEDLMSLYRNAVALLLPSFAEGFGIPMLEAMATGTPVIAARATSLPEVGGDAAMYFDPHDVKDIAAVLEAVLASDCLLLDMAKKGLKQARRYHPSLVAQQVSAFWREQAAV